MITDKKLLYEGRPTEVISNEERMAMHQVLPYLLKIAKERGIAIPEWPPQIEG